ncbi:MAG: discoidin domain-containing protein [Puniceicoccales bacterium]|jgi:hypothetical protein|nr:discoidin domain-containing protein [Puniceicoccales bacterium]
MDICKSLGYNCHKSKAILDDEYLQEYVNLRLISLGLEGCKENLPITKIAEPLLSAANDFRRLLINYNCPADQRIIDFCERYFADLPDSEKHIWIPRNTFVTDRHGISRVLSLPPDGDEFHSEYIDSYRIYQGILHNPKIDKRTTKGVFHIVECGELEVPVDKIEVPKIAFARMLAHACHPPKNILELPFTSIQRKKAYTFVSGYLKPIICPAVANYYREKRMEIRFFVPGSLVNFLDMVESIFGNAGSPMSPENDPAMDPETWTGHTGCIIVAPHLTQLTKKELGLPHCTEATERQKHEGMCWENPEELYHNGQPFKVMVRDRSGVIISIIADSYNGYGKKEIKTQMSYSANLYGLCEEEHSGGALANPRYNLGDDFKMDYIEKSNQTLAFLAKHYNYQIDFQKEGYGIDKEFSNIIYVPEDAYFSKIDQLITWNSGGQTGRLRIVPDWTYILPNGYQIELKKDPQSQQWQLVGTLGEGIFCHKPSTVSGGGKSEISKSINDNILTGSSIIQDFDKNCCEVEEILKMNFENRFKDPRKKTLKILDRKRSLGSVIKMFQQSEEQTDEYNAWLLSVSSNIKELIYILKLHYRENWGTNWKKYFSVDLINGVAGHELKYLNQKVMARYLRVGIRSDHSWNMFSLRKDFYASRKISLEDDITSSVTIPIRHLNGLNKPYDSVKFVENCEYRLYQRPDDAIEPGYDHEAEYEMTLPDSFICNYQPLTKEDVQRIADDSIKFSKYTPVIQKFLEQFLQDEKAPKYVVCPSHQRMMPNGKLSSNMRYLQDRKDMMQKRLMHITEMGMRLARGIRASNPVYYVVDAVIAGRRNNGPEEGIQPLSVHNPLHYFELPELFMEFASNMTGKSPSTTGAGLEGVMTKAPFNALSQIVDLNNAFLSFIASGYEGYISSAGTIGPYMKVGHDISYIIPEIFGRMKPEERNPQFLIKNGYLEKCQDFKYKGKKVEASRLGYRINRKFVSAFFGRILTSPESVFPEEMLQPEKQNMEIFVSSMENIINAHQRMALQFFEDGTIKHACLPIKALLHIMAYGEYEGMKLDNVEFRTLFNRKTILESDWYRERLLTCQKIHVYHLRRCVRHMKEFVKKESNGEYVRSMCIRKRIQDCQERLEYITSDAYFQDLYGTIGADPMLLE